MKKILITTVLFLMIFTIPVLAGFSRTNGTCAMKVMILATPGQHSYNTRTNILKTSGQPFLQLPDRHS